MMRRLRRRRWIVFIGLMLLLLGIQSLFFMLLIDNGAIFTVTKSSDSLHAQNDETQNRVRMSLNTTYLHTSSIHHSAYNWIPTTNPQRTTVNSTKRMILKKLLQDLLELGRPADNTYRFNVTRSDQIPVDRTIDDLRPPGCLDIEYNISALPTVSVIVPFYNEALSVLLRTVHSLLSRSPPQLLREIILVDDNSTHAYLGPGFERYVHVLDSRVVLLRNKNREGLIRSRLRGAKRATSEVVVFLDAHTEHNIGWLEPLLAEINRFPNIVVQPHIAVIGQFNLEYQSVPGPRFRGGFGWDLRYAWFFTPKYLGQTTTSLTDPFPTPVLVGCAIAVRKSYFFSIGAFDEHLEIWGGEHFDLSFRTWMCGGRITTVTCSRVGHMFKNNSYSNNVIAKNLRRVADIWFDQYKVFYYAAVKTRVTFPPLTAHEKQTLSERKKLRNKLGCKNFKWYLEHIIPELKIPSVEAVYFGEIENIKTAACMMVLEDGFVGMTYDCFMFRILPQNTFTIDVRGRLMYENRCVHVDRRSLLLRIGDCLPVESNNVYWTFQPTYRKGKLVYREGYKMWCAVHVTNIIPVHRGEQMVQMGDCEPDTEFQYWQIQYKFTYR